MDIMEVAKKTYNSSPAIMDNAETILLDGDKCIICKKVRISLLSSTDGIRKALGDRYFSDSGKRGGLVFGVRVGHSVIRMEIVLAQKRSQLYLSLPFDVVVWNRGFDEVL